MSLFSCYADTSGNLGKPIDVDEFTCKSEYLNQLSKYLCIERHDYGRFMSSLSGVIYYDSYGFILSPHYSHG